MHFIFNEKLYKQVYVVAIESPLGKDFITEFKAVYYDFYVNNIFVLFKFPEQVVHFPNYFNSKHFNILFTFERR